MNKDQDMECIVSARVGVKVVTLFLLVSLGGCAESPDQNQPPPYPSSMSRTYDRERDSEMQRGGIQTTIIDMEIAGDESGAEAAGVAVAGGEAAGEIAGEAAGEIAGEAAGETAGEIAGEAAGETAGEIAGEAAGETAGEIAGEAAGAESLDSPPLPNRLDEPLGQVLSGITHYAPIDLNGDGSATRREIQVTGLAHPQLIDRDAVIYLPEAYFIEPDRSFPVLYAHDAQNLFSPYAPFGEWRLDEVIDALTAEGMIEPHIVVGVNNTAERISDYTSSALELSGELVGGGALGYAELLVNQLKPYVDLHFRTLPEREHTTLIGSSLGGLVSLYIYSQAYTTFGKIGAVSASLWWNYALNPTWRWLTTPTGEELPLPERIWVDIGGAEASRTFLNREGSGDYARHRYQQLVSELRSRGMTWGPNQSLGYLEDPFAEHNEPAWALRAPHMLRFLLSDIRPVNLSGLLVTTDQLHLSSGRACEVSLLRVEARYGDGLRLTIPTSLIEYTSLTEGFEVSAAGEVTVDEGLFAEGGALGAPEASALIGEVEVRFGGQSARIQLSAGGAYAPQTQMLVYAPRRPRSISPVSDQLYLASELSDPAWRPDGFALTSLDTLSSPRLLSAVGGYDRWWGLVPISPDPSGDQGSSSSVDRAERSVLCAPECAASQLTFKITRGAWERVEGRESGVDRENRVLALPRCQQEAMVTVSAWLDGE